MRMAIKSQQMHIRKLRSNPGTERLEAHRHRQNEIVGTGQMSTFASGKGVAMVVVRESDMFIHSHVKDRFHHSSIFAGEPVHFAGEIKVSQGRIEWTQTRADISAWTWRHTLYSNFYTIEAAI